MSAHGHESGGHKESAEHGGGKHGDWMKQAGKGLAALGVTYGVMKYGTGLLQAASVIFPPYLALIGAGAAFWYIFGKKGGGKEKAAHGHAGGGGHH